MQRLDGVEKAVLSLNRGLVTVTLKPENRFSLAAFKKAVRDSGFTAGTMEITAAGEVIRWKNRPGFRVGGRDDLVFLMAPTATDHRPTIEVAGTRAVVTGTVVESRTKGGPDTLRVTKVETPEPDGETPKHHGKEGKR